MILRLWRGWTTSEKAATDYQQLLTGAIAPAIVDRQIGGLRSLTVLGRDPRELGKEGSEFLTAMVFEDFAAVAAFAGGRWTRAVVPPAARDLLSRYDHQSQHYVELESFGGRLD